MKLQDYIKYYIGCRVEAYPYGWQQKRTECGKLVGIGIHDIVNIKFDTWQSVADVSISCVKIILRRLEDMTEEEAEQLAMIYSGAKSVERTKGVANNWHYYFCYFGENEEGELLIIAADGCAWYAHYFDEDQPGHRNIVDEHKAFHYLLRQGFDLFGLITAGLAIDIKTI